METSTRRKSAVINRQILAIAGKLSRMNKIMTIHIKPLILVLSAIYGRVWSGEVNGDNGIVGVLLTDKTGRLVTRQKKARYFTNGKNSGGTAAYSNLFPVPSTFNTGLVNWISC